MFLNAGAKTSLLVAGSLGLFVLALTLYFPPSFLRSFHSKGEPREALVAQAMLDSGNWVLPMRYAEENATKPPMAHWLMAATSTLSGRVTEGTARMPSLMLGTVILILLFVFLFKQTSPERAFLSVSVLASSLLWYRSATTARVDMTLAAFFTTAFMLFFLWVESEFKGKIRPILIIISMAAAILSKGPIGVVLPCIIFALYVIALRCSWKKVLFVPLSIALPAIGISGIWYYLAFREGGTDFFTMVIGENIGRFTGTLSDGVDPHEHSVWYLLGSILIGFSPWSLLVLFLPRKLYLDLFQQPREKIDKISKYFSSIPRLELFSWLCIVVFISFFAIPASKRGEYLLPIYPCIAILFVEICARHARTLEPAFRRLGLTILCFIVAFYVIVIAGYVGWSQNILTFLGPRSAASLDLFGLMVKNFSLYDYFLLSSPPIVSAVGFIVTQKRIAGWWGVFSFTCAYAVLLFVMGVLILPRVATQLSFAPFASDVQRFRQANVEVCTPERLYGLSFYLRDTLRKCDLEDPATFSKLVVLSTSDYDEYLKNSKSAVALKIIARSANHVEKPGKGYLLVTREGAGD